MSDINTSGFTLSKEDIANFGIETDAFEYLGTAGVDLVPTGSRFPITIGETAVFKSHLGTKEYEAQAVFHGARLTRLSHSEQPGNPDQGRPGYAVAAAVLNHVYVDLFLVMNDVLVPLYEVLWQITKQTTGRDITLERFLVQCHTLNFPFLTPEQNADPETRKRKRAWTMITNHLGADPERIRESMAWFEAQGAIDVFGQISDPRMIQAALSHEAGLEVTAFEVGRQDRSQSQRNQGFVDLVSAVVENFTRVLTTRKEVRERTANLDAVKAEFQEKGKWPRQWNEAKAEDEQAKMLMLQRMTTSWTSQLGGAQQRMVPSATGEGFTPADIVDPTNVPCGRITVLGKDEEPHEMVFWQNQRQDGPPAAPVAPTLPVTTVTGEGSQQTGDEEPF